MVEPTNRDLELKLVRLEADIIHVTADLAELKETQRWMSRLVIAQFLALMVGLVMLVVGRL